MKDGQYILPGELAVLVGFVLLPAAVFVLAVQAYVLHKTSTTLVTSAKLTATLLATLVLGSIVGVVTLLVAPSGFGKLLGIKDVAVFGHLWPVWPFSFVSLGAAAAFTSAWLMRSNKNAA